MPTLTDSLLYQTLSHRTVRVNVAEPRMSYRYAALTHLICLQQRSAIVTALVVGAEGLTTTSSWAIGGAKVLSLPLNPHPVAVVAMFPGLDSEMVRQQEMTKAHDVEPVSRQALMQTVTANGPN